MIIGTPRKPKRKKLSESILLKLQPLEKQAFRQCADLCGIPLTSWFRERIRLVAIKELENAGKKIPFINDAP